jgi:RIO-like serine/threonine protein kinase
MESSVHKKTLCDMGGVRPLRAERTELLDAGAWANAKVLRYRSGGEWFVLKSFQERSWFVRWTIGVLLTWRELRALRRLEGLSNIPQACRRVSYCALSMRYIEGEPLGAYRAGKRRLPEAYFIAAEQALESIHRRKLVHLDLRRGNNWFVSAGGDPVIIDFQSALGVDRFPPALRDFLFDIDLSGLYKMWDRLCEQPLDAQRRGVLKRVNRRRRLWFVRGYAVSRVFRDNRKRRG